MALNELSKSSLNAQGVSETQQPLPTESLLSFCRKNNYVQIYKEVRTNINGYPYLTFINPQNKAENIYFSKKIGEEGIVVGGERVSKAFLRQFCIGYPTNKDGEERVKLVLNTREDLEDLLG